MKKISMKKGKRTMEVTFESLGLSQAMLKALEEKGYGYPTTIQAEAIPYFLQWRYVIAKAPTGTGKTFAFGIPMIEHIDPSKEGVQGLILAPTRELAIQIGDELQGLLTYFQGIRVAVQSFLLLYVPSNCRFLCSSFRFQHFQHFIGGGGGGVLLEIAGNDKDRITYADFRHAIRAAGAAVILWGVGHRRLSFLFISFFSCPIFSCAVAFRKLLPVKRTGEHISIRRS